MHAKTRQNPALQRMVVSRHSLQARQLMRASPSTLLSLENQMSWHMRRQSAFPKVERSRLTRCFYMEVWA